MRSRRSLKFSHTQTSLNMHSIVPPFYLMVLSDILHKETGSILYNIQRFTVKIRKFIAVYIHEQCITLGTLSFYAVSCAVFLHCFSWPYSTFINILK